MDSTSSSNSMDSELYQAAANGDLAHLQKLTPEQKLDLRSQLAPNRNTLLHVATEFCQLEFAKELVGNYPSLLCQQNSSGDTALHVAAREDLDDFVEFFIESAKKQFADVENGLPQVLLQIVNSEGDTALHCGARLGNYTSLEKLVKADPELCSMVNNSGESPLYLAAASGYCDVPQVIIDSAPSASYKGANGLTALHTTLYFLEFDIEKMRSLVEWKREMIKERDDLGWTPLHYASFYGKTEAIKLFLEYERSAVYILDNNGGSLLHIAAFRGHIDAMEEILNSCPNSCYLTDNNGRTALHTAVLGDQRKVVKFILETPKFARLLNKPDRDGNMPLHLATHFKLYNVIKILTKNERVNLEIKNRKFLTALDVYNKHEEEGLKASVTRYLLNRTTGIMTMQNLADAEIKKMNPDITAECSTSLESKTEGDDREISDSEKKTEGVDKEGSDSGKKTEEDNKESSDFDKDSAMEVNLLVATLVATMTFAAGFTVPGGVSSEKGPDLGKAVFSTKAIFQVFVVFNTMAFSCSVFAVLLQFHTSLTDHKQRVRYMGIAAFFTTLALLAMVLAFASGTHIMLTKSMGFSTTPYVMCACFALLYFAIPFCDPGVEGFRYLRRPQKFLRDIIVRCEGYME